MKVLVIVLLSLSNYIWAIDNTNRNLFINIGNYLGVQNNSTMKNNTTQNSDNAKYSTSQFNGGQNFSKPPTTISNRDNLVESTTPTSNIITQETREWVENFFTKIPSPTTPSSASTTFSPWLRKRLDEIFSKPLPTTQASTTQLSITQPSTTQPSTTQPSTTKPSTTQPSTTQPSTTKPSTTQPSTTQPSTTQPSTTKPSTTQPSTTQSSTTQHSTAAARPVGTTIGSTKPSDPNSENCICVEFYLCINGTIKTDGVGLIDVRMSDDPCGREEVCCMPPHEVVTEAPRQTGCGYRNSFDIDERIEGDEGEETAYGEFPWMVAIFDQNLRANSDMRPKYICGGSLIHPQAVLTAVYCVTGIKKKFIVRAGDWDIEQTIEPFPHQEIEAQSVIFPDKYDSGHLNNDVALVILKNPFQIGRNIDVLCLPSQSFVTPDTRCYTIGWGTDRIVGKRIYQAQLRKIEVPIVEGEKCQKIIRKTSIKNFHLHRNSTCAGGEGKYACTGDVGGPMICPISGQKNRFYQAGILSSSMGCGKKGTPGLYTNVANFRNWIDNEMRKKKLDVSSYEY